MTRWYIVAKVRVRDARMIKAGCLEEDALLGPGHLNAVRTESSISGSWARTTAE